MNIRAFAFLHQPLVIHLSRDRSLSVPLESILLGLILLLGAVLRLVALDRWSFWTDELYTWRLVQNLTILQNGVPDDQHPPLYYLLLHYLIKHSDHETWLRLPSALAGILSIPLAWRIGVDLRRRDLALLAAALLALSPIHIWYAREARMYSLATLFWLASLLFYIRVIRRDSWWDALGLALATTLGLLTAYPTLGLWTLEVSFFWLFWYLSGSKPARFIRWLVAQGFIAAVFVAWWPYFQKQLDRSGQFNWSFFGIDLALTLADTVGLALIGAAAVAVSGIFLWLLVRHWPPILAWAQRQAHLAAWLLTVILITAIVAGAIPRGLSIRRQLLVFWPLLILLGSWALLHLDRRSLTAAVIGLSWLLAPLPVVGDPLEDWRAATQIIATHAAPEDTVVLSPGWTGMAFDYYYRGEAKYRGLQTRDLNDFQPPAGDTVWLILLDHPTFVGQTEGVEAWFKENGIPLLRWSLPRHLTVVKYQIRYSGKGT